jgi:hypothetical protein
MLFPWSWDWTLSFRWQLGQCTEAGIEQHSNEQIERITFETRTHQRRLGMIDLPPQHFDLACRVLQQRLTQSSGKLSSAIAVRGSIWGLNGSSLVRIR